MSIEPRQAVQQEAAMESSLSAGLMLITFRLTRGKHGLARVLASNDISRRKAALLMRMARLWIVIESERDLSYRQAVTVPSRLRQLVMHYRDEVEQARRWSN